MGKFTQKVRDVRTERKQNREDGFSSRPKYGEDRCGRCGKRDGVGHRC